MSEVEDETVASVVLALVVVGVLYVLVSRRRRETLSKRAPTKIHVSSWMEFRVGTWIMAVLEKFKYTCSPPSVQLMEYACGYWNSAAMYAAAKLRLADLVEDHFPSPVSTYDLSRKLAVHEDDLYRLMRALATKGVFAETPNRHFVQTPLSDMLRTNHPLSMWGAVVSLHEEQRHAFARLFESVDQKVATAAPSVPRKSGFEIEYGEPFYDYLDKHSHQSKLFDEFMKGVSNDSMPVIAQDFHFEKYGTIVDVGGGDGTLLKTIYEMNLAKRCKGCKKLRCQSHNCILFDRPAVVSLTEFPTTVVVKKAAGSFFDADTIPVGDLIILKEVLHNWTDENCLRILSSVSQRMSGTNARILVIDVVLSELKDCDHLRALKTFLDLHMLTMLRGMERTKIQFAELVAKVGLEVEAIIPMRTVYSGILLKKA
eukprot:ANDGO_01867.mRNA.1 Tabersonine 16-O-methyltransferase